MLKKFSVSNFRGFNSRIELDLSNPANYEFNEEVINDKGVITKGLIYGINNSGKSNLCRAIFDITLHLTNKGRLPKDKYTPYLNLYSPAATAEFEYEFDFDNKTVVYRYEKDESMNLVRERLFIDGKEVISYDYVRQMGYTTLKGAENVKNFSEEGSISRVKLIRYSANLSKNDPDCAAFEAFTDFVDHMLLFYSLEDTGYQGLGIGSETITKGIIRMNKTKEFERFLRDFGIEFDLVEKISDEGDMDLYCHFDDKDKDVPFRLLASSGTHSLALFYYWYAIVDEASFVLIDEFDAFYHYRLAKAIVTKLKELKNKQIFLTTHNTDLLSNDLLRPDCYFILDEGTCECIHRLTNKDLRLAHNLQKMYKAGVFNDWQRI